MNFKKETQEFVLKQLGKGARGAFGKLKKAATTYKAKKAGSKRIPADLKEFLSKKPIVADAAKLKSKSKVRKALEVFPFVGAKTPKKVPLKKSGPTTIKGINIKTKAGKEFGEKIKNQPKRIRGQKPEGMRDDLPADIDVPSFLKKRPKKMKDGGGFPDLSGDGKITKKDILIGRGVIKKKGGGLVEATNKLKAQGLNIGGEPEKIGSVTKGDDGSVTIVFSDKSMKKVKDGKVVRRGGPLTPKMKMDRLKKNMLKNKMSSFKDGGPVRGKARGMGAAIKGGGYNV